MKTGVILKKTILSLCVATFLILNGGYVAAQVARELSYEQLLALAQQGNADAQYKAGVYFNVGENGFPKDDAKAFYWAKKSAEQGNSFGQWVLGIMYHSGKGTAKSLEQAVFWYQKSADQNNQMGQENLAAMYQEGWGVARDWSKAAFWYKKAADQGNEKAKEKLAALERIQQSGKAPLVTSEQSKVCSINPKSGLPKAFHIVGSGSQTQLNDVYCALRSTGRKEALDVISCIENLNSLTGIAGGKSNARLAYNTCIAAWDKLYLSAFLKSEQGFADCMAAIYPDHAAKNPNFQEGLISKKRFGHTYANTHEPDGSEGRYLRLRADSDQAMVQRLRKEMQCLPKDADYTMLRLMVTFGWGASCEDDGAGKSMNCRNVPDDSSFAGFRSLYLTVTESIDEADAKVSKISAENAAKAKRAQEEKSFEQSAIAWRKKIQEGDYTNKGMVIGFRGNLVEVEIEFCNYFGANCYTKRQFFRRDDLYPPR